MPNHRWNIFLAVHVTCFSETLMKHGFTDIQRSCYWLCYISNKLNHPSSLLESINSSITLELNGFITQKNNQVDLSMLLMCRIWDPLILKTKSIANISTGWRWVWKSFVRIGAAVSWQWYVDMPTDTDTTIVCVFCKYIYIIKHIHS